MRVESTYLNERDLPPIIKALMKYSNISPLSFHTPGHINGQGFKGYDLIPRADIGELLKLDLTEVAGIGSLHPPEGCVKEALELASKAFGADRTFFLINGSTCGIAASIYYACKSKDNKDGTGMLLAGRDSHSSVSAACALHGIPLKFISSSFDVERRVPLCVNPADVEHVLCQYQDASAVLITSPNYYGQTADVTGIAHLVHSKGKLLLVDEAHGAHLHFAGGITSNGKRVFPKDALRCGADIVVQSAHKTLPALTQSAFLHIKGNCTDGERMEQILSSMQTTSPSWLLMAFADAARHIMTKDGKDLLKALSINIQKARVLLESCNLDVPGIVEYSINDETKDPTRLVFNVENTGLTGFEFSELLSGKSGIYAEMADIFNIVCITTVSHTYEDIDRLYAAMRDTAADVFTPAAVADCAGRRTGTATADGVGDAPGSGGAPGAIAVTAAAPGATADTTAAPDGATAVTAAAPGATADISGKRIMSDGINRNRTCMFNKAAEAINALCKIPSSVMDIYEALSCKHACIYEEINKASGRISAGSIIPYPPGVPVINPGEIIDNTHIEALSIILDCGGYIKGVSKDRKIKILTAE